MSKPSNRFTRPPGAGLDPALQAISENIEILNGARGNGMDRAVLLRDLADLGLASLIKGAGGKVKPTPTTPGNGNGGNGGALDPTIEFPTAPTNVLASGGFSNVLVEWDSPTYKGHAYAEILRAGVDDFSKAVKIGQTAANLYSDAVGTGVTNYYWIRFVNKNNQVGPIQSTAGVKGQTTDAIGDILDQLKGQIDESFFTADLNSRFDNVDANIQKLFGDVQQIDNKFEDKFIEVNDHFVDVDALIKELTETSEILAEAAMEASVGVEIESETRRKVTARIEEKQRVIISDQIAMAQDIKTITASVDDNKAQISSTNTALVQLDKDTQAAVKTITERLDTQQSNIDDNKASITTQQQTIVELNGKVADNANDIDTNTESIKVVTQRVDTLTSEVGDNKAEISKLEQTVITIDGKATDNASEIDKNAKSIEVVTTRLDKQQSEIDDNKASITSQAQTIVRIDGEVQDNKNKVDKAAQDVEVITQRVDSMKSEVDKNTAEITDTKQTLVTVDGKVSKNEADIANANQNITTMTQRLEKQQSEIDGNTASITSQAQTIVTIDGKVSKNSQDIDEAGKSIETLTQKQDEQKSELDGAKATIESNSQTIARIEGELGADGDGSEDILAEAVMSSAIGVDNEGSTRRKVTARIEKQQRVIMTDQAAMAQELTKITASVEDNKAEISSVNTALVEFDKDTRQALKTLTERLDTQQSNIDDNTSSITTQQQTIVEVKQTADGNKQSINVMSQQLNTVESELGDTKSAVSTNSQTIAKMNADGTAAYEAQWGVKASVGDIQAGIGLTVKQNPDGSSVSQCTVLAGQFSVGWNKPGSGEEFVYPFIVGTNPETGEPGVFIDTAFIKAAKIQDLVAGDVVADTVKATAKIVAPEITGGTISGMTITGTYVQSDNYVAGVSGYRLRPDGAEFNSDVIVNAMIKADQIVGDIVSAKTKTNPPVSIRNQSFSWARSALFGTVEVVNSREWDRTMQVTLNLQLDEIKAEAYSTGEGRLVIVTSGQIGNDTYYSRSFFISPRESADDPRSRINSDITMFVPIPRGLTGTLSIYAEGRRGKQSRTFEVQATVQATATNDIWSGLLLSDGGDLA